MNRILLTVGLLVATAGTASAEVKLNGEGRFGVVYNENGADNKVVLSSRLRFNIDAKFEANNGVTYGGRIRFQNETGETGEGSTGARFSPAQLIVTYEGLTFQLGNADTAYDSVALLYNAEIGYLGRAPGADPRGSYFSSNSDPYDAEQVNRYGLFLSYAIDNLNLRASYIQPDQVNDGGAGFDDEYGFSADYTFDKFTVAGAYVNTGAGISGNENYFAGVAYAVTDAANVGFNFIDNGEDADGANQGQTYTFYANYAFDAFAVQGYVANNNASGNRQNTTYGVGGTYDLGGATLAGSVQLDNNDDVTADLGVNFEF